MVIPGTSLLLGFSYVSRRLSCSTFCSCFREQNILNFNDNDMIDHTSFPGILLFSKVFFSSDKELFYQMENRSEYEGDSSSFALTVTMWFSKLIHSD